MSSWLDGTVESKTRVWISEVYNEGALLPVDAEPRMSLSCGSGSRGGRDSLVKAEQGAYSNIQRQAMLHD